MRNASDIFCLNEECTDGMQMFSVNGNCPMRIKRRHQTRENECFEYGRQLTDREEETLGKGDVIADGVEKSNSDEEIIGIPDGDTCREYLDIQASSKSDQKGDSELQFRKLNQTADSKEKLTESAIMRNPLTGAGMEIEEHKKPKKGAKGSQKWTW